jgi:ribosomal protein S14
MSRQSQWKLTDNLKRKLFIKTELKRKLLKSLIKNLKIPNTYRHIALWNYSKLQRITSKTTHVNRCVLTGRGWYVLKKTQYSRFILRTEANKGNLPGFRRASW